MHTRAHIRALTGGLALLLTTTACSSVAENISERAAEEILEQAAGGEVDLDLDEDGGSVSVTTDDGSFSVGADELPETFPASAPLPADFTVLSSMSGESEDGESTVVTTVSTGDASFDDLTAFFDVELAANGWEVTERTDIGGPDNPTIIWIIADDTWTGQISVGASADGESFIASYLLNTHPSE